MSVTIFSYVENDGDKDELEGKGAYSTMMEMKKRYAMQWPVVMGQEEF
jgi:hypothetical protein